MPRLTARDAITLSALIGLAILASVLGVLQIYGWSLATLAILIATIGVVARVEFATRRPDVRAQLKDTREMRRMIASTRADIRDVRLTLRRMSDVDKKNRLSDIDKKNGLAALEARLQERLPEKGGPVSPPTNLEPLVAEISAIRSEIRGMRVAQQLLSQTIAATKDLVVEVAGGRSEMAASIGRLEGQLRYLETDLLNDVQALAQLVGRYSPIPSAPLPSLSGWAMSPAALVYMLDAIDRTGARVVVECGSGTSTVWLALAMKQKGSGSVLALEHNIEYARKTRALLEAHGLSEWARVHHAPLVPTHTSRGEFQWYDITSAELPSAIDILLVDGPPGATGPHARYPAVPQLLPMLRYGAMIVVDDSARPDERETIEYWTEEGLVDPRRESLGHGIEVLAARHAGTDL